MNTIAAIRATAVGLSLLLVGIVPGQQPDATDQDDTLRVVALDRSGLLVDSPDTPLYIGSSFNHWEPGGTPANGLVRNADGVPTGWFFKLPRDTVAAGIEFKFTRGSWETVEVDDHGGDIENRRIADTSEHTLVFEIGGFADQRGSRWSGDGDESTVVGEVDVWTIESEAIGSERTVRVWTPPGYHDEPDRRYPVLYMHDGQNLFDANSSYSGEWGVDESVTELVEAGTIPPLIVVGMDNCELGRAFDYLPFDAGEMHPEIRGGGADDYLRFVIDEVMPEIGRRYRVLSGPANTGLGGSSLGGVITLYAAVRKPGVFGAIIIESPTLWVGDGRLMDMARDHPGPWPHRVFVAQGDAESGIADYDKAQVELTLELKDILGSAGLDESRLLVEIGEGDRHHESAWRRRLPGALEFLFSAPDENENDGTP